MNDEVSVYSGVKPKPVRSVLWRSVIDNVQSEKYKDNIERCRAIKDPVEYREYKKKLPSVTFAGTFSHRSSDSIITPTGFIIPDLDHLPDLDSVYQSLIQDENIWFVFRSPSNDGMKCGIRAEGITNDDEHKIFYAAVERYFSDTYGIKTDPACKDIARLTFVSSDPNTFINPNPSMFDVAAWAKKPVERFYNPPETNNGWRNSYGQKVLESCCRGIAESAKGQQHNTRLRKAKLVGGFISSGFIDEAVALAELESAVIASGAVRVGDAMKTISDGIRFGKEKPIFPENRPVDVRKKDDISYYCDVDEMDRDDQNVSHVSHVSNVGGCNGMSSKVSDCKQDVSGSKQDLGENSPKIDPQKPQNLAGHILEWIRNSTGSFTTEQIDREFCLTSRIDKNNRAICLHRYIQKKLISSDKRIKGKYHIINSDLAAIDIDNVVVSSFEIALPFGLDQFVSTPQKSIIVIAGSSNAGKTALILNILKDNLSQQYKKLYLMSEMGAGEYVDRLKRFSDVDFAQWKTVTAAERSYDFNGAIEHHNKDGLTCVDFLEEVDGEYFKIATDIRNIYEALGTGVAVIAIQKKTDSDFGRGGQATTEKARLYMAVDLVAVQEHSIVCALKIIKLKRYVGRNLQGHEIHFRIHSGSQIEAITDWMRCEPGMRDRLKAGYEAPNRDKYQEKRESYIFQYRLKNGEIVGVNQGTFDKWIESYPNIDVAAICEKHSRYSFAKESYFTDKKKWFFQMAGILSKENDKHAPPLTGEINIYDF